MTRAILPLSVLMLLIGCSTDRSRIERAVRSISVRSIERHVAELASDRFMGRKPFTEGEEITTAYLADQLRKIKFGPAFDGSYFQKVPMAEITSHVDEILFRKPSGTTLSFRTPDEAAVISPLESGHITAVDLPLVFAGFGINAPEYGWNDYSGLDVRGKMVIVLVNDPGLYTGDSALFRGREMTYYGRWTYKYEEAARQGAAAVLIIHDTEGAGYEYNIPRKSSISPRLYIQGHGQNNPLCDFTGWLPGDSADRLLKTCGLSTDSLRAEACKQGFRGFPLNINASVSCRNEIRYDESSNVAGILKGSRNPDECIVFTAHWDHFGIGESENGDSIYNGAVDNATAMAWALAAGKAFSSLGKRPERSIVLLFPTAEEAGLLGSLYYTEHPVIAMENTAACLNNDLMLPIGRMKDVMITGYGQSELDDIASRLAEKQGRYVAGDPNPHTGMYFRSDHFAFAKKGVPSLYARGSIESLKYGKEWAAEQEEDYIRNRYHRPSDNYEAGKWDFGGIAEDAGLAFSIAFELSFAGVWPGWKESSEFRNLSSRRNQ